MAKTRFENVDRYIEAQAEVARAVLARVRAIIRKAVPEAEERISYQLPAYRLPEGWVIYLGAWRQHYSLYPVTDAVVAELGSALAPFEVEKGTIRFSWVDPVPVKVIARIVKVRTREVLAQAKATAAPPTEARGRVAPPAKARAPAKAPAKAKAASATVTTPAKVRRARR